jgi:SPP1 gp7 family putative phage head morphogenesis protein
MNKFLAFAFKKPFFEAISFFKQKGVAPTKTWKDFIGAMTTRVFTMAGVTKESLLNDTKAILEENMAKNVSYNQFKKDFKSLLSKKGWNNDPNDEESKLLKPWRIETIFRTNVQTSFQAGRYEQLKELSTLFPYWEYESINDSRTRSSHRALNGIILRHDDPFWDNFYPPNGFNCRCTVNVVFREVKQSEIAEGTITKVEDKDSKATKAIFTMKNGKKLETDFGWDYNVGKEIYGK